LLAKTRCARKISPHLVVEPLAQYASYVWKILDRKASQSEIPRAPCKLLGCNQIAIRAQACPELVEGMTFSAVWLLKLKRPVVD